MTTSTRADALARAAAHFPWLGPVSAEQLLDVVRLELGHEKILDDLQPYGGISARAWAPRRLLHIVSGATPHAALQSLLRGLLLGGMNWCKLPAGGLREVEAFRERLPPELRELIEVRTDFPERWRTEADVVVAFGRDDTLAGIRALLRPDQRFIAHGHRWSFGLVRADAQFASVPAAARDASLFDQRGCLSPQVFFVRESEGVTALAYARRLAGAMADFQEKSPRRSLDPGGHAAIREKRQELAFRRANGEPFTLWTSAGSTDWTVVYDGTAAFPETPLDRFIFVKPLAPSLEDTLSPVRRWISTVAVWPLDRASIGLGTRLGASRICRIGEMQRPSPWWHQDGEPQLSPLVRWLDCEVSAEDL